MLYRKKPLVSVCIPTYNSALYLKESLESIINQSYNNLEIIISDNNSKDDTESIVKSFNYRHKIYYYRNITNIGCYNNYNKCINLANGEFIAIYHSDDIYDQNIVEKEVEFFQNHPNVGGVFTLDRLINENGKIIGETNIPKELKNKNIYTFNEMYKALLKNGNSFLRTPTFMTKISIYNRIGLFNEKDFGTSADLEMWLRILEKYAIGILDQTFMKYRISSSSGSASYQNERIERSDYFLVMDHFSESSALTIKVEGKVWKRYEYYKALDEAYLARNFLGRGNINKAKELLNKALSKNFIINSFKGLNGIKQLIITIILFLVIKVGFGKLFGNILRTISSKKYYNHARNRK